MAIYVDIAVTISSVSSEDSAGSVSSLLLRAVLLLTALCDTLSDSIQYSVQFNILFNIPYPKFNSNSGNFNPKIDSKISF